MSKQHSKPFAYAALLIEQHIGFLVIVAIQILLGFLACGIASVVRRAVHRSLTGKRGTTGSGE